MQFKLDRTTSLHLLVIVGATFLAFGVVMTGYFIADDTWQLQFAYRVLHGEWSLVTGNFVRSYLSLPSMDFYRPLLGISYLIDFALYGVNAAGFYLTNILMAALAGIMLYFIAKALVPDISTDRANALALTSALLFVVSPLHCEDICWISGRADLLAAPFYLGGLLAAIFARDWTSGKIHHRFYLLSLVAFAFSLMSKESAVTLPLVVAALFVLFPGVTGIRVSPATKGYSREGYGSGNSSSDRPNIDDPINDGKDQHIKKRKKIKGGGQKGQTGNDGLKRGDTSKTDTNKDGPNKDGPNKDGPNITDTNKDETNQYEPGDRQRKKEISGTTKRDWLTWAKQFVLFLTPYGILTIAYLFVRQRALGSFIGGYSGDMGEALSKWLLFRWFDPVNLFRMAFPVAKYTFHIFNISVEQTPSIAILGTIYAIILGVLVIRLLTQRLNLRLPLFLSLWLLASLVPLVKLWGMDANLHNQRVLYLYTAPMVMMLPALVFLPKLSDRPSMQQQYFVLTPAIEAFLTEICTWCFYAFTVCLIVFSALTSYNWVLAGRQVQGIKNKTADLIADLPKGPDNKILVVAVPKDYLGAHVLMGGVNLLELLEPPFTAKSLSQYLVSFQRALVGPAEPVSVAKLKQALFSLHDRKAYFWQPNEGTYKVVKYEVPPPATPESIDLPIATSAVEASRAGLWHADPAAKGEYKMIGGNPAIALHNLEDAGGDGLVITGLDINPLAFDYLFLSLSMPRAQAASGVYLTFDGSEDARAPFDQTPQICKLLQVTSVLPSQVLSQTRLNIKMSHYGEWYRYKKIRRLKITFSNIPAVNISQISVCNAARVVPQLFVMGREPKASGEYSCEGEPVKFYADAGLVKEAKSCQVEISKVNQSWDTFLALDAHGKDSVLNYTYNVPLRDGKAFFQLDPRVYTQTGFYDVRVALVNDKNEIVSDWSDLITLYRRDPKGNAPFCALY